MKSQSSIWPSLQENLGFFKCEQMPFGLWNAPATYQLLMQNCLGHLNLMYCLIYLDDVIVFLRMEEEHLQCVCVVFDQFCEHNLKLKPTKYVFLKSEINYLDHHVLGSVRPSKDKLKAIMECALPQTYTDIQTFWVGHYRRFIRGFAHRPQPLHEYFS